MPIKLADINVCSGCAACASVCPTGSISMQMDDEGFLQPNINKDSCVECNKCENTCPVLKPINISSDFVTRVYAAINMNNDVRKRSSSGGIFYAISKWIIEQGGVAFGARFNDKWEVIHDYAETLNGLEPFMRSKYVQSTIGETFNQAKQFLESGRWVLYSGTPCQIGGLKSFLRKDYDRLIAIDIICHGVPSSNVWRSYLNENFSISQISHINFRDKADGWSGGQYITILSANADKLYYMPQMENIYFRGFAKNIYLRRSCHSCAFKSVKRCADITLADFWGVQDIAPEMHDNKGTSAVFVHTTKGYDLLQQLKPTLKVISLTIDEVVKHNACMVQSVEMPIRRVDFFRAFRLSKSFKYASKYIDKDRLDRRVLNKLAKILFVRR